MSNISKMKSIGSILSKGVASEIVKQIERSPGSWDLKSRNEGFSSGAAQSYSAVSDSSTAKIGIKGVPIVGQ
tara:strand:- start:3683 stop:3898 length:216 start_codon:yes stop_codon:yes gene_type:complete